MDKPTSLSSRRRLVRGGWRRWCARRRPRACRALRPKRSPARRQACRRESRRLPGDAACAALLPHDPRLTVRQRSSMLLTRKSSTAAAGADSSLLSSLARGVSRAIPTMDRRAFLRRSGLASGPASLSRSSRCCEEGAGRRCARQRRGRQEGRGAAHRLRPLLGGLRDRRGGRERRVGAPGAGVRLADQPRRALRQRALRCASTATASTVSKYPMKLVNGKYERIGWDEALAEISAQACWS